MFFLNDLEKINDFAYKLEIKGNNSFIIYKTIKIMLKSVHYDDEINTIYFSAENVEPLKNYILKHKNNRVKTNVCIKMIDDLTKQMLYLKGINYGFYGFDINDILVIDGIFVFCSSQYLMQIVNDKFIFNCPFKMPYFGNPELIGLSILPTEVNPKCCYYSLGVLVVFCLLNNYLLVGNEIKSIIEIDDIISNFNNTKIYWFIKRSLEEHPEKRTLLLI